MTDIISKIDEIKRMLEDKLQRLRISANQIEIIHGISDISKRLGLFQSGELRFGNHVEPGKGFTGIRIGFPVFTYSSTDFVFAVVSNDVIVWGVTYTGAFYFSSLSGLYGTWTPTGTAGTNVDSITPALFNYIQVGNQIFFNGSVVVNTTAIGVFDAYLTIPVASDFTLTTDANGCGTQPGTGIPNIISIREDTAGNRLRLDGYAQTANDTVYRISGGYLIK